MEKYDVAIIGKGPAGISASLYTARANLKTLIIGADGSSLKMASEIENYFGFEQPVSGKTLLSAGEGQAHRLGVRIVDDEVTSVAMADGFEIKSTSGSFRAGALLIAAGQPRKKANIPGLQKFEGRGVSYCTTCDGFFYRGKKVGVLGSGSYAVEEAQELLTFTKDITIFTNGEELSAASEYEQAAGQFAVDKRPVREIAGSGTVEKLLFEDGEVPLGGLFVAYGSASSVDFAVKMGILVKDNAILVDHDQRTNLEGVYAAGDCTGGIKQVSAAVYQGAAAGIAIIRYLKNKKEEKK